MYYIINQAGKRLSQFIPNDVKPKLKFLDSSWYHYETYNEAFKHLEYIRSHGIGQSLSIVKELRYVRLESHF